MGHENGVDAALGLRASSLVPHAHLRHSDSAAFTRRPAPVKQLVVVVIVECKGLTAVGTGDDEDAVAAHLAQLGDIAKQPLRTQVTANAFDGRGSGECHVGATFHAYRTCHSLSSHAL